MRGEISAAYFIASLTYGGVVEEILMRWFLMSLLAWILVLIFARKTEKTELPDWIFIAANITAALLFAAGHLPATMAFFGRISPLILVEMLRVKRGICAYIRQILQEIRHSVCDACSFRAACL